MRSRRLASLGIALSIGVSGAIFHAGADESHVTGSTLPFRTYGQAAVRSGADIYLFGGLSNGISVSAILRFDVAAGTVTTLPVELAVGGGYASAVETPSGIYVFPGSGKTSGAIQRFDPASGSLATMTATLPGGISGQSVIWDGTDVYLFGGSVGSSATDKIFKYSPSSDIIVELPTRLPTPRSHTSAVWTGTGAFIFGGETAGNSLDQILRFQPSSGSVAVMAARLPSPASGSSAVWNGYSALVFGGRNQTSATKAWLRSVVRYDPVADVASRMSASIVFTGGEGREGAPAVWVTDKAIMFGGYYEWRSCGACTSERVALDEIVTYSPRPGSPQSFIATSGPRAGIVTLAWQAPGPSTYDSPLVGYRIYRGDSAASMSAIADVGSVLSFTDETAPIGVSHFYSVAAMSASSGTGKQSPSLVAYAPSASPPPNFVGFRGPGVGEVRLTWDPPTSQTSGVTGYRITRRRAIGPSTVFDIPDASSYIDSGLDNGVQYYYSIRAVNAQGEGLKSSEVQVKAPSPPSEPRSVQARPGIGSVEIFWELPTDTGALVITRYRIYRGPSAGQETLLQEIGITNRFSDVTCPLASICHYYVTAVNAVGEGDRSAGVSMFGQAIPPVQ